MYVIKNTKTNTFLTYDNQWTDEVSKANLILEKSSVEPVLALLNVVSGDNFELLGIEKVIDRCDAELKEAILESLLDIALAKASASDLYRK